MIFTVRKLGANKMAAMVERALGEVLRKTFNITQRGVRSVVYNIVEQVVSDPPRTNINGEMLDVHITKCFETDEATGGLSKRLLPPTSFMEPIATFVRAKSDTVMKSKKYSTTVAPKERLDTIPTFNDESKSLPSRSDSGNEKIPRKMCSKRCLKRHCSKWESKDEDLHSSFFTLLKEKYDTSSEAESADDEQSGHRWQVQYLKHEITKRTLIRRLTATKNPYTIAKMSFWYSVPSVTACRKCSTAPHITWWISSLIMTTI